ncbi:TPA: hypothetical protein DD445_01665 [Candidatus Nomurabacteria bacterium]|nr:hypothetical protein [Candidatus Nomurabacteria bacterium]HBP27483.1 hypothetical protein [Candidatus Nomurabacteria bacterium]HBR66260.1 hypothetical protein [Candidatus Nomurabacteria bacterium]HCU47162.1 hypothetical protein [Candidatus Nomurabacteria bacterium]
MNIQPGPSPSDSVQRFNSYGWTIKRGAGDWVSQNTFAKAKLTQSKYSWPDEILIDINITKITTPGYLGLGLCIGILDTTENGIAGYSYGPIQNISGWQTIKREWIGARGNTVSAIGLAFASYATDSGYVGIELQANNLRFVYNNGDTILVDPFQHIWPSITDVPNEIQIPSEFVLSQNYPNPFNPSTTINYQVPEKNLVTLKVYDILGREIETLVNEEKPIGNYEVNFNASNLPSGAYFYKLQAGSFVETKKMILLK